MHFCSFSPLTDLNAYLLPEVVNGVGEVGHNLTIGSTTPLDH